MLQLLLILTCLTIINAFYIKQNGPELIIYGCELHAQEYLNLKGLKLTEDVEDVIFWNCSGVIDDKTFTKFPRLARLKIYKSNIEAIDTTLPIKHLDARYSYFPNLDEDLQQKLPQLEILWWWYNKDFQVDPHVLKNFKKLTRLSIWANVTEDCITNELFKGLDLQELGLRLTNIRCISEDSLNNLKNLRKLDLSFNHISNFEKATFKNLTELKYLNLQENHIKTIDLNIFASQKNSLEELDIPWNVLKQSEISAEELLKAFPKLEFLRLAGKKSVKDSKAVEFCEKVRQNETTCYV